MSLDALLCYITCLTDCGETGVANLEKNREFPAILSESVLVVDWTRVRVAMLEIKFGRE